MKRASPQPTYGGIMDVFRGVYSEGGVRALYRGVGMALFILSLMPIQALVKSLVRSLKC